MHHTRASARTEVRNALKRLDRAPGNAAVDLEAFLDSFIEEKGGPHSGWGGPSKPPPWASQLVIDVPGPKNDHYFAIRNEDLDLLGSLMPASGSVGVAYALGTGLVSPLVGAGIAVVLMGRKVLKKGVKLTKDQYRILMALKVAGPSTEERLATVCATLEGRTDGPWAKGRIDKTLAEMQGMVTPGGSVINLATKDGKGLWHPNA